MQGRANKKNKKNTNKQKYYEDIITLMPGHVYWKDKDGVFLGCNLQQARDAGFNSPQEMIGKTDADMPWHIQTEYLRNIDLQIMRSRRGSTLEELFELPNGTKRTYLSNKLPLFDENDDVSGILGISFDITDRKKLEGDLYKAKKLEEELIKAKELAEAASVAKTEFLENMRHDLRTPLTGIVGFSELIKIKSDDQTIVEYADNLIASSNTLLEFLNDILEAVRVLTGDMPIVRRKFSLREIVEKIIQLVTPKCLEKNLQLSLCYDKLMPKYIIGDPKRIQRILLELISNALNFTNDGNIKINIELAKKDGQGIVVKCSVTDTGIGIPADKQEDIFLRFKRLTPSYKGIYKGAGLGLAIVKQFIDDLKGEIYCQSKEGNGTTFICLFLLQEALLSDDDGSSGMNDSLYEIEKNLYTDTMVSAKKSLDRNKSNVLLVEDQELAAIVAESIVSELGCSVDVASDGNAALKYFDKNKYDLIFMDVGLPDTSGYELTKQIRTKEWRLDRHVPIIALTAHIDRENKQKCIEAGMDAVLSKPLTHSTAKDIISAFIPAHINVVKKRKKSAQNKSVDFFSLVGKPVDLELGAKKVNSDIKNAKKLVEMLIKGFNKDLPALKKARNANDWTSIQTIIHKHRGGSAYCGTPRFEQASAYLEDYLIDNKTKLREELYQQMLDEMEKICNAMVILKDV